jgi:hypothetical protein
MEVLKTTLDNYSRIVQIPFLLKGSIEKAIRLGKQFRHLYQGKWGNQGPQWDKYYGVTIRFPSPTEICTGALYWDYVCIHVPSTMG